MRLREGDISPGDYLAVTVIGPAKVKVDPAETIKPGNVLTVNDLGLARKIRSQEINGLKISENSGSVGKALEDSDGSGTIMVFVNCK